MEADDHPFSGMELARAFKTKGIFINLGNAIEIYYEGKTRH